MLDPSSATVRVIKRDRAQYVGRCGTLCEVEEVHRNHNEFTGQAGTSFQIAVNNGPISMTSPPPPPNLDGKQAELLQKLADETSSASGQELSKWGLRGSDALPVRWHTAAEDLFDYWEKIQTSGAPVSLEGQFTKIRRTYEAVESRRLVVLGRAGAGKTMLAHRLILDLLKNNPTGPVPVLFSLGDWNPSTELRHWLAEHLIRDYPFLGTKETSVGSKLAEVFIERGLIVPVLDGFDEILGQHHPAAIRQISTLDLPLIVTSRLDDYARAAHEIKAVGGAAAIALEDLTLGEAEEYLLHSTGKTRAPAWTSVFEQMRIAPDESLSQNLTAVLTTPLMITLARTVYNDDRGHDPGELLDAERFPTTEALEGHLLAAYLHTTYVRGGVGPNRARHPEWRPEQARRWLGYLATHLQERNTHDLAWWRLPDTLHHLTRRGVTTVAVWLAFGLPTGLLVGGLWGLTLGLADGLKAGTTFAIGIKEGLSFGFFFGAFFGLVAGWFSESGFKYRNTKSSDPPRFWIPPQGPQTRLQLTHTSRSLRLRLRSDLLLDLCAYLEAVFSTDSTESELGSYSRPRCCQRTSL